MLKAYEVTEKAGEYIANLKVVKGQIVYLTDRQADYELRLGTIKPYISENKKNKKKV